MAVDHRRGSHHDPVKMQEHAQFPAILGQGKMPAVNPNLAPKSPDPSFATKVRSRNGAQ